MAVNDAEDEAHMIATAGVQQVLVIGVERSRRVFMPEAVFNTHRMRTGKGKIRRDSIVVAGGMLDLGIGLATRSEMTQPTFFDLLDVPHDFWVYLVTARRTVRRRAGRAHSVAFLSVLEWSP
jgi:mitofusin